MLDAISYDYDIMVMMGCEDIHMHEAFNHFRKARVILIVDWTAGCQTTA